MAIFDLDLDPTNIDPKYPNLVSNGKYPSGHSLMWRRSQVFPCNHLLTISNLNAFTTVVMAQKRILLTQVAFNSTAGK